MKPRLALPLKRRALFAIMLPLLFWSVPAQAVDEDTQVWFFFNTIVPLAGDAMGTFEVSPRAREVEGDFLLTRFTVEVPLSDWAVPGAGAAYIAADAGWEWRGHQQITFISGPLSFRTRVEQRIFEGAPRAQLRLRQRVGANVPLTRSTTLTGAAELLYIARTEDPQEEARVETWRGSLGVQQQLDANLTIGATYLLMLAPRPGAPDRLSHIPQVTLVFRPGSTG